MANNIKAAILQRGVVGWGVLSEAFKASLDGVELTEYNEAVSVHGSNK